MADDNLLIILGTQLFPLEEIKKTGAKKIFMKEDLGVQILNTINSRFYFF